MSDEASSADTSSSTELKGGHAPAIKVGGMRVGAPRPRHTSHGDDKNTESGQGASEEKATESGANEGEKEANAEDVDDEQASGAVANRAAGQMVGGKFVSIQKAFPTEAVKHIHDKPGTQPKHDFHQHSKHDDHRVINQPGLQ